MGNYATDALLRMRKETGKRETDLRAVGCMCSSVESRHGVISGGRAEQLYLAWAVFRRLARNSGRPGWVECRKKRKTTGPGTGAFAGRGPGTGDI